MSSSYIRSKRWRLCFLMFLAYAVLLLHRVNLSMAIVCIVRTPAVTQSLPETLNSSRHNGSSASVQTVVTHSNYQDDLVSRHNETMNTNNAFTETTDVFQVDWDKSLTSLLLSSYFYGSIVTQVPAGKMADAVGGRNIMLVAFLVTAVCSLLTPVCIKTHIALVFVLRILIGLAAGAVVPAGVSMIGAWAPPRERAAMISLSGCGFSIGPVLSYLTSGYLCAYGFDGGWPSVFYIHGIIASVFVVLWWFNAYSSPADHPTISRKELTYILATRKDMPTLKNVRTPWRSMCTSRPMWGSIVAHFAFNWGFYSVLINVPMFMNEVLQFDITQNAFFSALPYIAFFVANIVWAPISFTLWSKQCLTLLMVRRLFTCTSLVGSSVCLILAGHVTVELRHYSVLLLCCTCMLSSMCFSGFLANHAEYAGVHSGTAYGISNAVSVVSAILSAIMAGVMTPNGSQREWQNVFYLSAGVSIAGAIVYYVCSSATLQKWAETQARTDDISDHQNFEFEALTQTEQNSLAQ